MIIATAGHVDHGKTLLVQAITGVDTDRLAEEKHRGLTIDLGFAYTDLTPACRIGFVDVPGHIRFINNMLAGVGAIDYALLVVAADDGPMPQTREHLAILDLLGVSRGMVALTKTDRVDAERVRQVADEIHTMLDGTALADAEIFPVSAVTAEGLEPLIAALGAAASEYHRSRPGGWFRLAIDRCFTVKGTGLVVTGSVFAGEARIGDQLYLKPGDMPVRVRGIRTQNRLSELATAGDRCALNVTGQDLDRDAIHRGSWLTANRDHRPTDRLDARIRLLPDETRPLQNGTPVHVHAAASHVTGRIATLEASRIEPGESALVQLALAEPIFVCHGDSVVIRDQASTRTLGGGTVIDPFSPRRGRAKPARLAHLYALGEKDTPAMIGRLLKAHPEGLYLPRLFDMLNMRADAGQQLLEENGAHRLGDHAFSEQALQAHKDSIVEQLDRWHENNPEKTGLPENQLLLHRSGPRPPPQAVASLVEELVSESKLHKAGNLLQRPGHHATLTGPEAELWKQVQPILSATPTRPPVIHDLAKQVNLPPAAVEKLLGRCAQLGYLVRPVKNRFFLPEGLDELESVAHSLAKNSPDGMFSAAEYRDATGVGRNLAIELLEYFDRTGVTQRVGDRRKIRDSPGSTA